MPIILLFAAIFLISKANQASAVYNEITFTPGSLKNFKFGVTAISFDFILNVNNPTPYGLGIKGINGNIISGNTILGTYIIKDSFILEPKKTTSLKVTATASNFSVAQQLFKIISSGKIPALTSNGFVETTLGRFNFTNGLTSGLDLKIKKVA